MIRATTHAGAVYIIVYPAKLSYSCVDHILDIAVIRYVNLHGNGPVFGVSGVVFALPCSILRSLTIEVCEEDASHACFSKGKGDFFANTGSGLRWYVS